MNIFVYTFSCVGTILFASWLIAVEQCIVSVTRAAWFAVASARRVKYTSTATHHSTSCIQNSWRQSEHGRSTVAQPPCAFLCDAETAHGRSCITPTSSIFAVGNISKNTSCRVLRGCSRDHCSTIATVFSKSSMALSHLSPWYSHFAQSLDDLHIRRNSLKNFVTSIFTPPRPALPDA